MFVTGVSGEPFRAVVLKLASSAGAPLASSATAASASGTRFSFKVLSGAISCALVNKTLQSMTMLAANIFIGFISFNRHSRTTAYMS
jgi:hypothetical protein